MPKHKTHTEKQVPTLGPRFTEEEEVRIQSAKRSARAYMAVYGKGCGHNSMVDLRHYANTQPTQEQCPPEE